MAYSYKGSISFGMVYIPVKLEASVQSSDVSFNQLEKSTMSRVRYKKTCDACDGRSVEQKDIVKAYEYEKDKYVVFSEEEFEKIKSKRDKTITIERFVDLNEIDPLYYDKAYYVIPSGAEKAFSLLKKAMEETGKVGIAKTVLGTKDTLVAIRCHDGQMLLNTMFFASEIKSNPAAKISENVSDDEIKLAEMIIKNMSGPFEINNYKDEYNQKVMEAIENKIAGKEIAVPQEARTPKVIDLMEALQQSLKSTVKGASAAPVKSGGDTGKKPAKTSRGRKTK